MSFKCNGNLEEYVHIFIMKCITKLVREHDDMLAGYKVAYIKEPTAVAFRDDVVRCIAAMEAPEGTVPKSVLLSEIDKVSKHYEEKIFTARCKFNLRGDKVIIKESKMSIITNTNHLRRDLINNLHRVDDWLNNDVTTQLRHEVGHLIDYHLSNGMKRDAFIESRRLDDEAREEYQKWRETVADNDEYDIKEDCQRYFSLPDEAKANELMGISMDELIRIEFPEDDTNYGIEIKPIKLKI